MTKKTLLKVLFAFVLCTLVVSLPVFADVSTNFPDADSNGIGKVNTSVSKIWGSVVFIVQVLAFGAIVFAGVRYMFAAADQKADIKKGLGMLTVGAILVFAASTVVQFVVNAAKQVL